MYIYFRLHQHEIPNALPGKNGRRESTIIIFKSEFFFQPFLGGGEFTNAITGKIKLVKEVLVTLDGHWDDTVMMKDKKTGVSFLLFFFENFCPKKKDCGILSAILRQYEELYYADIFMFISCLLLAVVCVRMVVTLAVKKVRRNLIMNEFLE